MKLRNMTERITFYSIQMGINPETHRPIKDQKVKEFTVWAEVPKLSVREFVQNRSVNLSKTVQMWGSEKNHPRF